MMKLARTSCNTTTSLKSLLTEAGPKELSLCTGTCISGNIILYSRTSGVVVFSEVGMVQCKKSSCIHEKGFSP